MARSEITRPADGLARFPFLPHVPLAFLGPFLKKISFLYVFISYLCPLFSGSYSFGHPNKIKAERFWFLICPAFGTSVSEESATTQTQ